MSELPSTSEPTTSPQKKSRSIWWLFLILAAVYVLFSLPKTDTIKWYSDLDAGLKEASRNNQFALVMFSSKGCPNCGKMKREVFSTTEVRQSLKNWAPIEINVAKQTKTAQTYMVNALPTFIIFTPTGREIKRFEGTRSTEEFVKIIKEAEKENP